MNDRMETMRQGNTRGKGFGEKPHDIDYRSQNTTSQMPLGHPNPKNDIHHIMGVQDHLRPLLEGLTSEQQDAVIRLLNSKGVRVSNDPRNLVSVGKPPHRGIHERLEDVGIDTANRKADLAVLNKISQLPFKERLVAAEVFAEHIYPGIVEQMHDLGHKVPTVAENIAYNNELIDKERRHELTNHLRDIVEAEPALNSTGRVLKGDEAKSKVYIDRLLDRPSPQDKAQAMKDKYQAELMKEVGKADLRAYYNKIQQASGDDRQLNINADTVYLNKGINGNGKRKKY